MNNGVESVRDESNGIPLRQRNTPARVIGIHRLRIMLRRQTHRPANHIVRICHALWIELGHEAKIIIIVIQLQKFIVHGQSLHRIRIYVEVVASLYNTSNMKATLFIILQFSRFTTLVTSARKIVAHVEFKIRVVWIRVENHIMKTNSPKN